MFFAYFLFFSKSIIRIENETITSVVLHGDDVLQINGSDKTVFVHASAHYFSGKLQLFTKHSENNKTFDLEPSSRLMLVDSQVEISYTKAQAPCKIDIYVINRAICGRKSLHIRGVRKSRIFSPEFGVLRNTLCYFYDFGIDTKYAYHFPPTSSAQVTVIRENENHEVVYENLQGKVSVEKLPLPII